MEERAICLPTWARHAQDGYGSLKGAQSLPLKGCCSSSLSSLCHAFQPAYPLILRVRLAGRFGGGWVFWPVPITDTKEAGMFSPIPFLILLAWYLDWVSSLIVGHNGG